MGMICAPIAAYASGDITLTWPRSGSFEARIHELARRPSPAQGLAEAHRWLGATMHLIRGTGGVKISLVVKRAQHATAWIA